MEFDFDASRDDLAKYINEPTELEVCDKTKAQRSRVWSAWERYGPSVITAPVLLLIFVAAGPRACA